MWSEKTHCKVCGVVYAGMDDMCPNRDNVCKYCCLKCGDTDCDFSGSRDSIKDTINSLEEAEMEDKERLKSNLSNDEIEANIEKEYNKMLGGK